MDTHSVPDDDGDLPTYRSMVMKGIRSESNQTAWLDLVHMGRPVWKSIIHRENDVPALCTAANIKQIIYVAASKLLWGANPKFEESFSESTMFGVASILCRLGLRPNSSSPLASRAVADFMAVLSYVSHTNDHYVCNYASDPMLTFGAARLWYEHRNVLAGRILPQLRKPISLDAVDTGEIGVLVARILLLLAMDECAGVPKYHAIKLMEFHSVNKFMRRLRGSDVKLGKTVQDVCANNVQDELDGTWENWKVGFSHFVQLEVEPTEECLWYMLSRRAAGVFPRGQEGPDLFIPIFTCDADEQKAKVSMILVHVEKDGVSVEGGSVETSAPRSRPIVFDSASILGAVLAADVIHVAMNLGDSLNAKHNDAADANSLQTENRSVLYLQDASFVPVDVLDQLGLLLAPWWKITKLVKEDLPRRKVYRTSFVLTEEKLKYKTSCTLSKYFRSECEDEGRTLTPTKSETERTTKKRKLQVEESSD